MTHTKELKPNYARERKRAKRHVDNAQRTADAQHRGHATVTNWGPKRPITGARERERRQRQIARGQLREENGLQS